ncbi:MAG: NTP transferase domain-containing protein [Rhodobacterales bacterium]|nr:NTP transferase domain-containing protein [Rhodobacterales bacterium]
MVVDGYVLAGGRSTRMGVDKARVPFPRREPMAISVAAIVGVHCRRVRLVRRVVPDGLPWPGVEVVRDQAPVDDAHPLWGLAAALEDAKTSWVFVTPCDVPSLTAEAVHTLIAAQVSVGGPVVAEGAGNRHVLLGVFPKDWSARAKEMATQGASVRRFAESCTGVSLPDDVLMNLNRWSDAQELGPIQQLRNRLPHLDTMAEKAVVKGEQSRLAQLGCIDPQHS